jgi:hypothetical protein
VIFQAKRIFYVLFLIILISSCKLLQHERKIQTNVGDTSDIIQTSYKNRLLFNSVILSNVSVSYNLNGDKAVFNGSIKIVKDSLLTISVGSVLGIEIFRIYLDNDSVYLIDRTNRNYSVFSFREKIKGYSEFLNIHRIQDLILGNIIDIFNPNDFQLLSRGKDYSKFGTIKEVNSESSIKKMQVDYIIRNEIRKPVELSMKSNSDKLHILYEDYRSAEENLYAGKVGMEMKSGVGEVNIYLEIGSCKYSSNLIYHIVIPDGYKRKI